MDVQGSRWIDKSPWYNTTICSKPNGQSFEDLKKQGARTGIN